MGIVRPLKKCIADIETIEGTPVWVIKWSNYGYVPKNRTTGYPSYSQDLRVKTWKTKKNAERYLSLKDPGFAASCVIEERRTFIKDTRSSK